MDPRLFVLEDDPLLAAAVALGSRADEDRRSARERRDRRKAERDDERKGVTGRITDFFGSGQERTRWLKEKERQAQEAIRYYGGPGFSEAATRAQTIIPEALPGADIRDVVEASGQTMQAILDRDLREFVLGTGGMAASLGMAALPSSRGAVTDLLNGTPVGAADEAVSAAAAVPGEVAVPPGVTALRGIGDNGGLSLGGPNPPGEGGTIDTGITGSFNPLDETPFQVDGRDPADWTDDDWTRVDEHFGGKGEIGGTSPLVTITDTNGREISIPGGTEGKFSYRDMLFLKAEGIDPNTLSPEVHQQIHDKMVRSVAPDAGASDAQVWNGLVFGMTSPNNPLFPNQLAASRLRLRGDDTALLDDLGKMIPWQVGDEVPKEVRKEANDRIAARLGLNSRLAESSGLGARGTADYTRVAELAKVFKQDPSFFRKRQDEEWDDYVERLNSQVSGLSAKTGSFGSVWQDPVNAGISAVDRHMATLLEREGGLFSDATHRRDWEARGLALWNKKNPDRQFDSWLDLTRANGTGAHIGDMLLGEVNKHSEKKFRTARTGEINPNVPERLRETQWVVEPAKVKLIGDNYRRALTANRASAEATGQGLFSSQWMQWDRIRHRLEPHENMMPGLSRLPAMTKEQLRRADAAHQKTGHKNYGKERTDEVVALRPTRPNVVRPEEMTYFREGSPSTAAVTGGGGPRRSGGSAAAEMPQLSPEEWVALLGGGGLAGLSAVQLLNQQED